MIKLSDYVAKRLKEHYGVNALFMVSGGGAMHLNDSFGRFIPYIANHHEQACSIAAEGYARVNQELAVVNVTTGPGGLNCLNGVFGQWTDSVPVLYISGQVKRQTLISSCSEIPLRQLGDQEVDIVSVVKPLTKYAVTVKKTEEIKYHLDRAIYEATNGRFGPVWLDIPIDVQASMIDENDLVEFTPKSQRKDLNLKPLLDKLLSSKRPLIIAGYGIRLSKSEEAFYKLIEKFNIPVVSTFNGADVLPSSHRNFTGIIGTIGQRAGNFALQNADLILCLGTRNNIRQASYNWENFAKNAFKVVVDIDKAELQKPLVKPDLAINADLKDFLTTLLSEARSLERPEWLKFCQNLKEKYSFKNTPEYQQTSKKINPYYFTRVLTSKLSKDDVFVCANATPSICTLQSGCFIGQRVLMNSGNASMGYGLPASIGARLNSKNRVVCFEGDGSIMMNIQELQTIKHNNLDIKIFIINNSGYSSIRQTQKNFFDGHMTGSGMNSGVSVPDFCEVAKAFGLKSVKIENPQKIEEQIEEVFNTEGAVVCEIMTEVDYTFTPKLSSRKLEDGTMVSPSLEDMFPFLPREEFEENMIK